MPRLLLVDTDAGTRLLVAEQDEDLAVQWVKDSEEMHGMDYKFALDEWWVRFRGHGWHLLTVSLFIHQPADALASLKRCRAAGAEWPDDMVEVSPEYVDMLDKLIAA